MSTRHPDDAVRSPVNSSNEWDSLEEVVVGRIEDSVHPPHDPYVLGGVPRTLYRLLFFIGGRKKRPGSLLIEPARRELEGLVHILEARGVTVRRPDIIAHSRRFSTPDWSSRGHSSACPRDCFLVIGDEIIEAPMSWRNRYHERHAYYALFKEYFDAGARWTAPPKPPLREALYDRRYRVPAAGAPMQFVTTESEVVFDAADFIRCGRDIFAQRSNATNVAGITWLRRHLGDAYRVHVIETRCRQPMHIDTTLMPLGPGRMLVNPHMVAPAQLRRVLGDWEILVAPEPSTSAGLLGRLIQSCSPWVSMNVLMLDPSRAVVDRSQTAMISALERWGIEPIRCDFLHFSTFGGGFHCATLDIRRRGNGPGSTT